MDDAAEKLLEALRIFEQQRWRLENRIAAVKTALTIAGVPVPSSAVANENEYHYARHHLFAGKRLIDCCERIINDHPGEWLSKSRVVYLLERGGYTTDAREIKNSVDCTLRRLAALGRVEVQKRLGAHGNKYRSLAQGAAKAEANESNSGEG